MRSNTGSRCLDSQIDFTNNYPDSEALKRFLEWFENLDDVIECMRKRLSGTEMAPHAGYDIPREQFFIWILSFGNPTLDQRLVQAWEQLTDQVIDEVRAEAAKVHRGMTPTTELLRGLDLLQELMLFGDASEIIIPTSKAVKALDNLSIPEFLDVISEAYKTDPNNRKWKLGRGALSSCIVGASYIEDTTTRLCRQEFRTTKQVKLLEFYMDFPWACTTSVIALLELLPMVKDTEGRIELLLDYITKYRDTRSYHPNSEAFLSLPELFSLVGTDTVEDIFDGRIRVNLG